jgi:23S rRNA (uracil1939-C5)-methyltransferase
MSKQGPPVRSQQLSEIELDVESLAYEGAAVARDGGRVVFVHGGAPGDRVRATVIRERRNLAEARVTRVLQPGPSRVAPPCPVAERCGGCDWQHVEYGAQLLAKRRIVSDALQRLARVPSPRVDPVVASPSTYGYRNRIRLHWIEERLCYYERASRRGVPVSDCPIAEPRIRAVLERARALVATLETSVEEVELAGRGELAGVTLTLHCRGRFAVADAKRIPKALDAEPADGITGVATSGPRWSRSWGDTRRKLVVGSPAIAVETVEAGFGQVNSEANRKLIDTVLDVVAPQGDERVWDLFSGAGNLSLPLAQRVREIVGVERDVAAVAAARSAAETHGLRHASFVVASVEEFLMRELAAPDVIVANPPRTGLERSAARLGALRAPRIVYVSCNPPTLARDLAELAQRGYATGRIRPVDLFPQTCRVETVCELVLT